MKMRCFCPEMSLEEFAAFDTKEMDLSGRSFYISTNPMVSHFPMNPELKIEKTLNEIAKKGFQPAAPLFVIFKDGLLSGKIMIEIVKPSVKDQNVLIADDLLLLARTYTGPKYLVPKALKEFDRYLMSRKIMTTDFFFWYHSCRECEKVKGNRTVILGKIRQGDRLHAEQA